MGEYANYNGEQIKIGTCENMYYLRADQARKVGPLKGNVDPIRDRESIRFRFPWPDEDKVEPGAFDPYNRGLALSLPAPTDVEHYSVQFTASAGYNCSIPCPESCATSGGYATLVPAVTLVDGKPLTVHRNGFGGAVKVVQQRYVGEILTLVCECGGCGGMWSYPKLEDAAPVVEAVLAEGYRRGSDFFFKVADRIVAGYAKEDSPFFAKLFERLSKKEAPHA